MPSVRVKKGQGYQSINDAQPSGRPRSQSLVSHLFTQPSQADSTTDLRQTPTRASDSLVNGGRPPARRPSASSKVSQHIFSTSRSIPQLRSAQPPPDSLAPPRQLSDIEESSRPHSFQRNRAGSYTVQGQQADLRVPIEDDQDRRSSSISLALEQIDEPDDPNSNDHHHDDIVEHLDVIGECSVLLVQTRWNSTPRRPANIYRIYPY